MSRQRPWRPEFPDAVIVARPSKWGNPVWPDGGDVVGQRFENIIDNWGLGVIRLQETIYSSHSTPPAALAESVATFRRLCRAMGLHNTRRFTAYLEPLADHDLACWCPLDQPCHADVLLELAANGGAS